MSPVTITAERERIRTELDRRRMARQAQAVTDLQAVERNLEREAAQDIYTTGTVTLADASARRQMRELAVAKRRDQLTRSMAYPMSESELVAACQHATLAAKVPSEHFEDVSQSLALEVIRRHGRSPLRSKLSAGWLRRRAVAIHIDEQRAQERAMGSRAAAEQLANWREADHRAAMAEAHGSDAIYALAAGLPVVDMAQERVSASQVARRLPGLSYLQRDAVRVALSAERNRPMSNLERQHYHAATAILRRRFHTAQAVRVALGTTTNAARALVDLAIRSLKGTLPEDGAGQRAARSLPDPVRGLSGNPRDGAQADGKVHLVNGCVSQEVWTRRAA